ncbi:alpha/beta-hydrolase [Pseudovirgaria hyperparasitica]|uniref:Alpha/beta-hydrolase n=1 Tax=Pseudovirgaria hyperparasitica TaxID=470096 RepID=A0A6A6WDJ6_9PEZI|nr:alpha/beta-hydrolase [Pseudovirgaria hyperparasitica]KAF2760040.1 alpha/beta-hydrolase [Pseudovirgaria hyperparasitica]
MTSNAPAQCCTVGVKHEGKAAGKVQEFGGYQAYVSFPQDKSTTYGVLLLPDVIGHEFINAQLIADQFAANGYFTVMPDLFSGDPVKLNPPEGFQIMDWLQNHLPANVDPIVAATIAAMRSAGVQKLGAVGYCFGGKYVARFLNAKGGVDAGFTAHPSFVDEEELRGVEGPLSIAAAETDKIFPAEKRRQTEDILKEMKATYQLNLFSGVEHGFAVRGDVSQKQIRFAKEQAFYQAVQWFDEHVKA